MKIYKIAVTEEQNRKKIDAQGEDIKDLKSKIRKLESDVKKVEKHIDDLNIGERRFWQQRTIFTSLQRKIERFEKLEQEWSKFKTTIEEDLKDLIDKRTRAQVSIKAQNTRVYKIADSQLDLFKKEETAKKAKEELPEFVKGFKYDNGFFVVIKAGSKYYAYSVSFEENIEKAKYLMSKNPGQAISWLRKISNIELEVTKDYPGFGTIIRDIKGDKNDRVR